MCFFNVKLSFGPIDMKRKVGTSVAYRVNHVTLTFDLTHDLDLGVFKIAVCNESLFQNKKWCVCVCVCGGGGGGGDRINYCPFVCRLFLNTLFCKKIHRVENSSSLLCNNE